MLRKEKEPLRAKEVKRVKLTPPKVTNRGLTLGFIFSQVTPRRIPYLLGFCIIIVLIINPYMGGTTGDYTLGELVDRDIKAPFTMSVVDKESTETERIAAENSVLPVYDYDNYSPEDIEGASVFKRIKEAFTLMRAKYKKVGAAGNIKVELSKYEEESLKKDFEKQLGADIPDRTFSFLARRGFRSRLERIIQLLIKNALRRKTISKQDLQNIDIERGIILSPLRGESANKEVVFNSFDTVTTMDEVINGIKNSIKDIFPRYSRNVRKDFWPFFEKLITPTLTFNREKTEGKIAEVRESVKPVVINIKKGEMIIRDGTFITNRELKILNAIKERSVKKYSVSYIIGAFILIFVLFLAITSFSDRFIKKFRSQDKDLLVMGGSILILLILFRAYHAFVSGVSSDLSGPFAVSVLLYLFPFAVGAMIVRLLLNSESAIIYAIFLAIIFGIFLERNLFFTIFIFFSSIIAAGMLGYGQDRAVLLKAGLKTGIFNVILVFLINLLSTESLSFAMVFYSSLAAFMGGILSALLTYAVIPGLEWTMKYTTDIRLLELANLNQPLLRELMVQCPGSYHHSIIVGNLVETAAEAINANSLFARVAAYYHDIGKIRKPEYFIENSTTKENKHDKLTPNMSALILISHVKDGVELAEEYKLGMGIRDIIQQHHGTTLIKYFFHKANKMKEQNGDEKDKDKEPSVEEKEFRYPGPKAQTKEAALVMIADHVEATVRSLTEPTHTRIRVAVQNTIDNLFADGQFDESDLTLRDLSIIASSFVRTLTAMYHQRIDYPSAAKGTEKSEGVDKAKEEGQKDKGRKNKISSSDGFKRLESERPGSGSGSGSGTGN